MFERLTNEERVVGLAALAAIVCSFMTWFSYDRGANQIKLNGFRSSVLGDVFVLATGVILFLFATHLRLVRLPRVIDHEKGLKVASSVALGAIVLEILFGFDQGQHIHLATGIALVASAAMFLGSRRQMQKSSAGKFHYVCLKCFKHCRSSVPSKEMARPLRVCIVRRAR